MGISPARPAMGIWFAGIWRFAREARNGYLVRNGTSGFAREARNGYLVRIGTLGFAREARNGYLVRNGTWARNGYLVRNGIILNGRKLDALHRMSMIKTG